MFNFLCVTANWFTVLLNLICLFTRCAHHSQSHWLWINCVQSHWSIFTVGWASQEHFISTLCFFYRPCITCLTPLCHKSCLVQFVQMYLDVKQTAGRMGMGGYWTGRRTVNPMRTKKWPVWFYSDVHNSSTFHLAPGKILVNTLQENTCSTNGLPISSTLTFPSCQLAHVGIKLRQCSW